ncbi:MAG: FAD-binding protein [Nocardioides sp.]|nr:FAD-binding protein [Nocardioides sp.]
MGEEAYEPAGWTWAGSHHFGARGLARPRSVPDLSALVAAEPSIRAVGSRHSFTDIADSTGLMVSLDAIAEEPVLVRSHDLRFDQHVRVPAGMRYGELATWLHARGRALPNLASLPHISVAGAVATGTHGSGLRNGSLATAVTAIELVDGRGDLVRIEQTDPDFPGSVVALGALGIVTHLELATETTYAVTQTAHTGLTWADMHAHAPSILRAAYSVSIFTRWADEPDGSVARVWTKSRGPAPYLLGTTPADQPLHVIPGLDPAPCTVQLGMPGPWHERLPHFRLDFTPSSGEELQSEYLLPFERTPEALAAVRSLAHRIRPLLMVGEVRAVAADDLWLSPAYGTDAVALHFTWLREPERVRALLPALEELLLPLGARPHWGKLFAAGPAELAAAYPRWHDFAQLVKQYDPEGRFGNAWLSRTLG